MCAVSLAGNGQHFCAHFDTKPENRFSVPNSSSCISRDSLDKLIQIDDLVWKIAVCVDFQNRGHIGLEPMKQRLELRNHLRSVTQQSFVKTTHEVKIVFAWLQRCRSQIYEVKCGPADEDKLLLPRQNPIETLRPTTGADTREMLEFVIFKNIWLGRHNCVAFPGFSKLMDCRS